MGLSVIKGNKDNIQSVIITEHILLMPTTGKVSKLRQTTHMLKTMKLKPNMPNK